MKAKLDFKFAGKGPCDIYAYYENGKLVDLLTPTVGIFTVRKQIPASTEGAKNFSTKSNIALTYYTSVLSNMWYIEQKYYDCVKGDITNTSKSLSGDLVALPISLATAILKAIKKGFIWVINNPGKITHMATSLIAEGVLIRSSLSRTSTDLITDGKEPVQNKIIR